MREFNQSQLKDMKILRENNVEFNRIRLAMDAEIQRLRGKIVSLEKKVEMLEKSGAPVPQTIKPAETSFLSSQSPPFVPAELPAPAYSLSAADTEEKEIDIERLPELDTCVPQLPAIVNHGKKDVTGWVIHNLGANSAIVRDSKFVKTVAKVLAAVPEIGTGNPVAALINFCKHQLKFDVDFRSYETSGGVHRVQLYFLNVII